MISYVARFTKEKRKFKLSSKGNLKQFYLEFQPCGICLAPISGEKKVVIWLGRIQSWGKGWIYVFNDNNGTNSNNNIYFYWAPIIWVAPCYEPYAYSYKQPYAVKF